MDNGLVAFPAALVAFTVKFFVSFVVGSPEITPLVSSRVKPSGNEPPASMLHVMGLSPVAASVSLYAVPTVPSDNDRVVITGALPPPELSSQAVKPNVIASVNAAIPKNLKFLMMYSLSPVGEI
jgi:hypothetical protein